MYVVIWVRPMRAVEAGTALWNHPWTHVFHVRLHNWCGLNRMLIALCAVWSTSVVILHLLFFKLHLSLLLFLLLSFYLFLSSWMDSKLRAQRGGCILGTGHSSSIPKPKRACSWKASTALGLGSLSFFCYVLHLFHPELIHYSSQLLDCLIHVRKVLFGIA